MHPYLPYLPLILFTVTTNAAAQIMLKYGMLSVGPLDFGAVQPMRLALTIGFNPYIVGGLATFFVSMCSHMLVLSRVELSFAYPFLSLAYVMVAIYTYVFFNEDLNAYRITGIGCIVVGTILIARS